MLKLIAITSAKLTHIGYDRDTATLAARFPAGKTTPAGSPGPLYDYFDVSNVLAARLLAPTCESVGKLFIAEVQGPRTAPLHRFAKVVDETKEPLDPTRYAAGTEMPAGTQPKTLFELVTAPSAQAEAAPLIAAPVEGGGVEYHDGKPLAESDEPTVDLAVVVTPDMATTFYQTLSVVGDASFAQAFAALEQEAVAVDGLVIPITVISTEDGRQPVFDELVAVRGRSKSLLGRIDALKSPLNILRGEVLALEKRIGGKLEGVAQSLDRALTTHRRAVEAETRRREQEAQVERDRLAREEAERVAEANRQQALLDAEALKAAGQVEAAARIIANPEPVIIQPSRPVILQTAAPRMEGERRTANWKWRYKHPENPEGDFPLSDPANHRYYSLDERKINAEVRVQKNLFRHAGVETWPDEKTSTSSR